MGCLVWNVKIFYFVVIIFFCFNKVEYFIFNYNDISIMLYIEIN